ncbi:MAG: hypothetical protein HY208_09330 [Nitrospirae bacterium]|nr:hypothetical protein [Nitrospirota bacterium]
MRTTAWLLLAGLAGCTSSITVQPSFQPLPSLSLAAPPLVQVEPNGFRFCYLDEPCQVDAALAARYQTFVGERFSTAPVPAPPDVMAPAPIRLMTEMHVVNDHQGRLFGYGLLFGPLAFLAPIPYPMALDLLTVSTTIDKEGKPIRVYRSRQLVEFWTYSAWGLRDPKLMDAAMRHHLRALERSLQVDMAIYQPPPVPATPPPAESAAQAAPAKPAS